MILQTCLKTSGLKVKQTSVQKSMFHFVKSEKPTKFDFFLVIGCKIPLHVDLQAFSLRKLKFCFAAQPRATVHELKDKNKWFAP